MKNIFYRFNIILQTISFVMFVAPSAFLILQLHNGLPWQKPLLSTYFVPNETCKLLFST